LSKALPQDVRGGLLRRSRGLVGTVYLGSPAAARLLLRLFLLVELEKLGELLLKTIDLFTDALNIQIVIDVDLIHVHELDKAVDLVGLATGLKGLLLSTLLDQSRLVLSYNLSSSLLGSLPTRLVRLGLVGLLHVVKLLVGFTDWPLEGLSLRSDLLTRGAVNARVTAGRHGRLSLPLCGLFDLVLRLLRRSLVVDVVGV